MIGLRGNVKTLTLLLMRFLDQIGPRNRIQGPTSQGAGLGSSIAKSKGSHLYHSSRWNWIHAMRIERKAHSNV